LHHRLRDDEDADKDKEGAAMGKRVWILALCLIALIILAHGCGQPALEMNTATPVSPTDPPAATEPVPAEEPTATQARPTLTAVPPTVTEEPDTPTAPPTEDPEPTTGPIEEEGRALLEERCTVCHTLDPVEASQKSRQVWEETVARMVEYGAQLTDDEQAVLIDYLADAFGN
jgi:hypothetical protein